MRVAMRSQVVDLEKDEVWGEAGEGASFGRVSSLEAACPVWLRFE